MYTTHRSNTGPAAIEPDPLDHKTAALTLSVKVAPAKKKFEPHSSTQRDGHKVSAEGVVDLSCALILAFFACIVPLAQPTAPCVRYTPHPRCPLSHNPSISLRQVANISRFVPCPSQSRLIRIATSTALSREKMAACACSHISRAVQVRFGAHFRGRLGCAVNLCFGHHQRQHSDIHGNCGVRRIEELVEAFEQELTVEDLELASADNEDLGVEDTLIVNDVSCSPSPNGACTLLWQFLLQRRHD